jgi:ribosome maturation factor RimP
MATRVAAVATRNVPGLYAGPGKILSLGADGSGDADEEVKMPGNLRSAVGQVDDRKLAGLLEPVVAAAGMDLETVRMTVAGKRRLLRIVVDSDHGVSLDDAADVSRDISVLLDASNALGDVPYTLEVSSPGVDRPLTEPRHWRRARGRLVRVKVPGEGSVEGRVLAADADGVTLGIVSNGRPGGERRFSHADLGAGSVQVEFGRIPDAELDDFSDPELDDAVPQNTVLDNNGDLGAGGDGH